MIDLPKPCPFCGAIGVVVDGTSTMCNECGAHGPYAAGLAGWNTRKEVSESPAEWCKKLFQHFDRQIKNES